MKNHRIILDKKGGILKILFILFILFAIAAAIGIVKIEFMVGEQLRLTIMPEYYEETAVSQNNVTFETDIKLYNKFLCEASCNYTLTDMSNNVLLDSGSFASKAFKVEHYSRDIPLTYNGYGTNLYLYKVECVNNYTTVCPANQNAIVRKSLMVVSYKPSEEQFSSLKYLNETYPLVLQNFVSSSKNVITSGKILDALAFPFDTKKYSGLEMERDSLDDGIGELLSIWRTEDYTSAKSYLDNGNMLTRSQSLLESSKSYEDYLYQSVNNHNFLLEEISKKYPMLEDYAAILSLNTDLSYLNSSEQASVLHFLMKSNTIISTLNSENYNFTTLSSDALELKNAVADIDSMIIRKANYGLMENNIPLYVYSSMLCTLGEDSGLCQEDFSMYPETVGETLKKFDNICTIASEIQHESGSSSKLSNRTDSIKTLALQYRKLLDYELMISQEATFHNAGPEYMPTASVILPIYKNYIINTLRDEYNITDIESEMAGLNVVPSDITLNKESLLLDDVYDIVKSCNSDSGIKIPRIMDITAKHYFIPTFEEPEVMTTGAPEAVPQCCIYDKCQSCEKHNQKNPLIMLHGHSFNKDIDAYRAIESFDGFEYAFMRDNLYFLTGMMVSGTGSTAGILGRYSVPVAVKPTYYLEIYNELFGLTVSESKDENIDTYALRLKESIDYVLYMTGNDKVDIVAHSMGGLVTRRYLQIFGTKNVGTVILIGTPNKGINENKYKLCKIFGADNECADMRSDGLFIKKLNDPLNQPDMDKMYLVIGKGCDTEGVDGDGIVTADSVMVQGVPEKNILYVEGECSEIGGFHRQLLNVYQHPEVYEFVKEKLGESIGQ